MIDIERIQAFLAAAEGRQWTAADTARVLRHIHAVEQTALAVGQMQGGRK